MIALSVAYRERVGFSLIVMPHVSTGIPPVRGKPVEPGEDFLFAQLLL